MEQALLGRICHTMRNTSRIRKSIIFTWEILLPHTMEKKDVRWSFKIIGRVQRKYIFSPHLYRHTRMLTIFCVNQVQGHTPPSTYSHTHTHASTHSYLSAIQTQIAVWFLKKYLLWSPIHAKLGIENNHGIFFI